MHTRCPHCSTTFSISQQHLEVAEGQVRCGACEQVFDGKDNVVDAQGNYVRKKKIEKVSGFETGADIFGMIEEASTEFEFESDPAPKENTPDTKQVDESWADALLSEEDFDESPDESAPPPVIETAVKHTQQSQSIVSEPVSAPARKKPTPTPPITKRPQPKPKPSTSENHLSDEFLDLSSHDNVSNPFRDSDTPIHKPNESGQNNHSASSKANERKKALENELQELESLEKQQAHSPPQDLSNKKGINSASQNIEQAETTRPIVSPITRSTERLTDEQTEKSAGDDDIFDQDMLDELNELFENPSELTLPAEDKLFIDETETGNDEKLKPGTDLKSSSLINELEEIAEDLENDRQVGNQALSGKAATIPPKKQLTSKAKTEKPKIEESVTEKPETIIPETIIPETKIPEAKAPETKEPKPLFELNFDAGKTISEEPQFKPEPKKHRFVYSALILVTSLSLAFQFAYFNVDKFSRSPQFRPYYQQACEILSCTLPMLQNLNMIRGNHLVVRQHPDYANTLLVDFIMTNTAHYPQLFPIMEMIFTDGELNPIKQRQFKPKEYLKGDLAQLKAMPAGKPIHVSLEIVDPGPKANSWEINFLPYLN